MTWNLEDVVANPGQAANVINALLDANTRDEMILRSRIAYLTSEDGWELTLTRGPVVIIKNPTTPEGPLTIRGKTQLQALGKARARTERMLAQ